MQVCIYAPPVGFKGQWTVAADLSARLLEYCEASGWRVRGSASPSFPVAYIYNQPLHFSTLAVQGNCAPAWAMQLIGQHADAMQPSIRVMHAGGGCIKA